MLWPSAWSFLISSHAPSLYSTELKGYLFIFCIAEDVFSHLLSFSLFMIFFLLLVEKKRHHEINR
jgi:hypothetical protein